MSWEESKEEIPAPDIESPATVEPTDGGEQQDLGDKNVERGGNSLKIDVADVPFTTGDAVSESKHVRDKNDALETLNPSPPISPPPEVVDENYSGGPLRTRSPNQNNTQVTSSGNKGTPITQDRAASQGNTLNRASQHSAASYGTSEFDKDDGNADGQGKPLFSSVRKRISHVTDLATGRAGGHREHVASIRSLSETQAMSSATRLRQNLQNGIGKLFRFRRPDDEYYDDSNLRTSMHGRLMVTQSRHSTSSNNAMETPGGMASTVQYRLQACKAKPGMATRMLGWVGFSPGQSGIYEDASDPTSGCACCGVRPNELVIRYLNWTFRASFFAVIFSGALAFFGLNLFFALLIWWSGKNRPSCIYDNGAVFGTTSASFSDAFALSWTTFSTAGYGVIFPATSAVEPDVKKCIGITLITSLESFVGLLFGSCCGAVIFGKISRIQSYAQVIFSDPIVIRYGKGVLSGNDDDASSVGSVAKAGKGDGEDKGEARQPLPCPVLEFRLVNTFHSKSGGEIIDATMNIIASIDERQACPTIRAAARRHRHKGKKKHLPPNRSASRGMMRRGQINQMGSNSLAISAIPETMPLSRSEHESSHSTHSGYSSHPSYNKLHQAFQEDPSGHLIPPRIFSRLALQTGHDHPFFKRVWVAQHLIDEHSPLLKAEARQMVHRNHGYWPEELNSYEAVRDSIHFDQILVSFSGTSNVDASSVYAQKAYQWIDLNVGYRFVNLLYRDDRDGSLRVDTSLINDVVEQAGGGGEPFVEIEGDLKHHDILVL